MVLIRGVCYIPAMRVRRLSNCACILVALLSAPLCVRATAPADSLSREGALKVYLEGYSSSYVKDNIPFVNYVRDARAADLHIIVSYIGTGSGGGEYSIELLGRGRFAGMNDTLRYFSGPTEIGDETKQAVVRTLKMGLMRYVARTPFASDMRIDCARAAPPRAVVDRWDGWVFRTGANGGLSGSQLEDDYNVGASLSAARVTETLKIDAAATLSYREDETALTSRTIRTIRRTNQMNALAVASVTGRWSAGGFASARYTTTGNVKSRFAVAPAIEFSVFPYREASFRTIVFLYRVDYCGVAYRDTTIYDKISERLWCHTLEGYMAMARPWGSAAGAVTWSQYFHDAGINSLSGLVSFSFRLFRGFSLNVSGSYTRDHDRIDQERRYLTDEEILLNLRRLSETYYYSTSIGVSYTFGSIYANVVNPRFSI
jgi:hypothetical protein